MDWILCYAPHPATMITTVFVSESPAISHVVDLHFTVVAGFSGPFQEIIANLGMVGPGEATAIGAVVVLQGFQGGWIRVSQLGAILRRGWAIQEGVFESTG